LGVRVGVGRREGERGKGKEGKGKREREDELIDLESIVMTKLRALGVVVGMVMFAGAVGAGEMVLPPGVSAMLIAEDGSTTPIEPHRAPMLSIPQLSWQLRVRGELQFDLVVDADGVVTSVSALPNGFRSDVVESGVQAMRMWRFVAGEDGRRVRVTWPVVGGIDPTPAERASAEGLGWWLARLRQNDWNFRDDCTAVVELDRLTRELGATIEGAEEVFARHQGTGTIAQHLAYLRSNEDEWLIVWRAYSHRQRCLSCLAAITMVQREGELEPATWGQRRTLRAALADRAEGKLVSKAEVGERVAWATVVRSSAHLYFPQRAWTVPGLSHALTSEAHFRFGAEQNVVMCGLGWEPRTWYFERSSSATWHPMCSLPEPWSLGGSADGLRVARAN
jgi:hypothetical protein